MSTQQPVIVITKKQKKQDSDIEEIVTETFSLPTADEMVVPINKGFDFEENKVKPFSSPKRIFTKRHLQIMDYLHNTYYPFAYPKMFGDELHEDYEFVEFRIIAGTNKDSTLKTQTFRHGGVNHKEDEIHNSLDHGFKLKHPPISVLENPDGTLSYITGNTRENKLSKSNVKDRIVAVFKRKDIEGENLEDDELKLKILSDLAVMGLDFNSHHDPCGENTTNNISTSLANADISKELLELENEQDLADFISNHSGDHLKPETLVKISRQLKSRLDDIERAVITLGITRLEASKIIAYSQNANGEYKVDSKMDELGFNDDDENVYLTFGYNGVRLAVLETMKMLGELRKEGRNRKLKIVIHCGTLTGKDLVKSYATRCKKFYEDYYNLLNQLVDCFQTHPSVIKDVEVIGALPQLGTVHGKLDSLIDFEIVSENELKISTSKWQYNKKKHGCKSKDNTPNLKVDLKKY